MFKARQAMKDVLFVQGTGRNVHAAWDVEFVESLRHELGPSYVVRCLGIVWSKGSLPRLAEVQPPLHTN